MPDLTQRIRPKRFKIKENSGLYFHLETRNGNRFKLQVDNCSINGMGVLAEESIMTEVEIGELIPAAKLSWEEHEFAVNNKIEWRKDVSYNNKIDYFSLDVDVMDPVYVGTGTPEMFGCTPEQVVNTIRNSYFKYFDLVEWIPDKGYPYIIQIVNEVLFK